jgi:16S rRNA (cytosine967-C5)-methyltransferase
MDITVSDIRESILTNLKKRFAEAGIKKYKSFIADLAYLPFTIHHSIFDLIICDAPCTGSGTWSRTPEQLYFFKKEKINEYALQQKKIVSHIISHLKPGGHLLYITCSVFRNENEEVVEFAKNKFHLEFIKMELLKGYDKKADTMFAALLRKPL